MPAMGPLPPGGDQNIGNRLVILQSVLISIATTFIALRLYVRTRITHALGLDDFFIVLALVRRSDIPEDCLGADSTAAWLGAICLGHYRSQLWAGPTRILPLERPVDELRQNCVYCVANHRNRNSLLETFYCAFPLTYCQSWP